MKGIMIRPVYNIVVILSLVFILTIQLDPINMNSLNLQLIWSHTICLRQCQLDLGIHQRAAGAEQRVCSCL